MENQTIPTAQPSYEIAPDTTLVPEPTKNWTKPFLLSLLGMLLAGGLVYAGVQIGKNQTPNQQPIVVQPIATPAEIVANPTAVPSPAAINPTSDPTAEWNTYESAEFNFSFKYPSELTYIYDQSDQYAENEISNATILIQNFDGSKSRTATDNDFQIVVYIANKSGQSNLENPQGEQTKTTINGVEVIKSFTTQKWELVPTVYFQSSPNKVAISLSNPNSTNEAWFDQIVSTFQFTN